MNRMKTQQKKCQKCVNKGMEHNFVIITVNKKDLLATVSCSCGDSFELEIPYPSYEDIDIYGDYIDAYYENEAEIKKAITLNQEELKEIIFKHFED